MDAVLCKVHGKLFSYCSTETKKSIRLVSRACAMDIDVHTGICVVVDDNYMDSIKFARNVKVNCLHIRSLGSGINRAVLKEEVMWIFNPGEMTTVLKVILGGPVSWKWIENSLRNYSNLTTLHILGETLIAPVFPYNKKDVLIFNPLKALLFSIDSHILTEGVRDEGTTSISRFLQFKRRIGLLDDGREKLMTIANNIYHFLAIIVSPNLRQLHLPHDDTALGAGSNRVWKKNVLREFLSRHAESLRDVVLYGWANGSPRGWITLKEKHNYKIPDNLSHLLVTLAEVPKRRISTNQIHALRGSRWEYSRKLLETQAQLQVLHCIIHRDWGWVELQRALQKNFEYLQVINVGCSWTDPKTPVNMELFSGCPFLKQLTFCVHKQSGEGVAECRMENLTSLIACRYLESVFIAFAICETIDLETFLHLPELRSLVLVYVGEMSGYGVHLGLLQEYLSLRSLDTLVVTQFYRQKHSWNYHRLKEIITSPINTPYCPFISTMFPTTGFGKYVHVGEFGDYLKYILQ